MKDKEDIIPKVGIVIVTWNKSEDVLRLLKSIYNISYKNYEVLIVDNASIDQTVAEINKYYPEVNLIINEDNLGGTGGFNSGMQYYLSKKNVEYVWLLDNDAIVHTDSLSKLIDVFNREPNAGLVGSAMFSLKDPTKLIEIGNFVDIKKGRFWGNLRFSERTDIMKDYYEVDSVSACSVCIPFKLLEKVGLWDTYFFIYCDDVDWSLRIKKMNHKIVSSSKSIIWHNPWEFKEGFNTYYYATRNLLYLMRKHNKERQFFRLILKELEMILKIIRAYRRGDYYYSAVTLKAIIDYKNNIGGFCNSQFLKGDSREKTCFLLRLWLQLSFKLIFVKAYKLIRSFFDPLLNRVLLGFPLSLKVMWLRYFNSARL